MEETWGWINSYLEEADRKLVYDYGFIKSRKGMFFDRYLEKNDMVRRTFERRIIGAVKLLHHLLTASIWFRAVFP